MGLPIIDSSFTATGNSDSIVIPGKGMLKLDFGTGTVNLQVHDGTNWVNTGDTWTDTDVTQEINGNGQEYRLNCSSYTAEISYVIKRVPWALQA